MPTDGVISESFEIPVLDTVRRYLVMRPDGTDPATLPTLVDLHGSGSWPEEHVAITGARARAALGAVVAVPQAGIQFRMLADWPTGWAWNVPGSPLPGEVIPRDKPDDLAFMRGLTERLIERHGVDPHRIHIEQFGAAGSWDAAQAHWDFVHEVELNGRRLRSQVGEPTGCEPTTAPPLV